MVCTLSLCYGEVAPWSVGAERSLKIVFLDDVIIPSKTLDDGIRILANFLLIIALCGPNT